MSPLIFISNDDGIHSPGLKAAAEAVHTLGDVLIVAPSEQQSGTGGSVKGNREEFLRPINFAVNGQSLMAYHCDCSPGLTFLHGMAVLCRDRLPDLVISGFNYGVNLSSGITGSGTVGVGFHAAIHGLPALAVSLEVEHQFLFNYGEVDWSAAIHFTRYFAEIILARKMPAGVDILKIDIPANATSVTPWKVTRLSRTPYFVYSIPCPTPQSRIGDALTTTVEKEQIEKGSDVDAVFVEKVISVTPLTIDCTANAAPGSVHDSLSIQL